MIMKTKTLIGIITSVILVLSCETNEKNHLSTNTSDILRSSKVDARLLVSSTEKNLCMIAMSDIVRKRDTVEGVSVYAMNTKQTVLMIQNKIDSIGKSNLISLPYIVFNTRISRLNTIELDKMSIYYCQNMIDLISSEIKDLENLNQKQYHLSMEHVSS